MVEITEFITIAEKAGLSRKLYLRELERYANGNDLNVEQIRQLVQNVRPLFKQRIDTFLIACFLARGKAPVFLRSFDAFRPLFLYNPLLHKRIDQLLKETFQHGHIILTMIADLETPQLLQDAKQWAKQLHFTASLSSNELVYLFLCAMYMPEWETFLEHLTSSIFVPHSKTRCYTFGRSLVLTRRQMQCIQEQRRYFDGLSLPTLESICREVIQHVYAK